MTAMMKSDAHVALQLLAQSVAGRFVIARLITFDYHSYHGPVTQPPV